MTQEAGYFCFFDQKTSGVTTERQIQDLLANFLSGKQNKYSTSLNAKIKNKNPLLLLLLNHSFT